MNDFDQQREQRDLRARGLILAAAFLSFGLSVALYFSGHEREGIFVGLWVPSILALGAFLAPRGSRASGRREEEAGR
jgi:hypothetical protein